jgi:hypothetical protein
MTWLECPRLLRRLLSDIPFRPTLIWRHSATSVVGHSLPTGHALTSRDVRNCSKAELRWCCGKFPTERVGKTVPAGGRRHELRGPFRSLRTEATFLPDHAGKKLDWNGVLRCRMLQGSANIMGGGRSPGGSVGRRLGSTTAKNAWGGGLVPPSNRYLLRRGKVGWRSSIPRGRIDPRAARRTAVSASR